MKRVPPPVRGAPSRKVAPLRRSRDLLCPTDKAGSRTGRAYLRQPGASRSPHRRLAGRRNRPESHDRLVRAGLEGAARLGDRSRAPTSEINRNRRLSAQAAPREGPASPGSPANRPGAPPGICGGDALQPQPRIPPPRNRRGSPPGPDLRGGRGAGAPREGAGLSRAAPSASFRAKAGPAYSGGENRKRNPGRPLRLRPPPRPTPRKGCNRGSGRQGASAEGRAAPFPVRPQRPPARTKAG